MNSAREKTVAREIVKVRPSRLAQITGEHPRPSVRSYDAAVTNRFNQNHFSGVDGSDADTLIRASLATLRNRARYEVRNNSYAAGCLETHANDLVGPGPRLQVTTDDADFNSELEAAFARWALSADANGQSSLADDLRLIDRQLMESGESFLYQTNAAGDSDAVGMRIMMIEPDRVQTPYNALAEPKIRDGIEYDGFGRPVKYHVLKYHPGDRSLAAAVSASGPNEYSEIPARFMRHVYRVDRPGQGRGIPEITPAIPLFAQLRRYTLAVLTAAEMNADLSTVAETDSPDINVDENGVMVGEELPINRGVMTFLPAGYKVKQLDVKNPPAAYKEFKCEILKEIGRSISMPFNVVAGDSSGYNYASGRLDWQTYFRLIRTRQSWLARLLLNWLLQSFTAEWVISSRFPKTWPRSIGADFSNIPVLWYWPGYKHVDPVKESVAQQMRLANLTTSLADECGEEGKDWEQVLRQRCIEEAKLQEMAALYKVDPEIIRNRNSASQYAGATANAALADEEQKTKQDDSGSGESQ